MQMNSTLISILNDVAFYRHEAETATALGDMATVEQMQIEENRALSILSDKDRTSVLNYLKIQWAA